jgi:hypothetical protein
VTEELLTECLHAEVDAIVRLFRESPDAHLFFDVPAPTDPQRRTCFFLLAHLKLVEAIDETFTGRHQSTPSLNAERSEAFHRAAVLVSSDAPAWVQEINEVAELLPDRVKDALPPPLRKERFDESDITQDESLKTLNSIGKIQALTTQVLDSQLRRLEGRWAVAKTLVKTIKEVVVIEKTEPKKSTRSRTPDKQRVFRDKMIAQIHDAAEGIHEFLKLMDERNVRPQPTWSGWPNSWRDAYKNPRLRKLIQQDKSRALVRFRKRRRK